MFFLFRCAFLVTYCIAFHHLWKKCKMHEFQHYNHSTCCAKNPTASSSTRSLPRKLRTSHSVRFSQACHQTPKPTHEWTKQCNYPEHWQARGPPSSQNDSKHVRNWHLSGNFETESKRLHHAEKSSLFGYCTLPPACSTAVHRTGLSQYPIKTSYENRILSQQVPRRQSHRAERASFLEHANSKTFSNNQSGSSPRDVQQLQARKAAGSYAIFNQRKTSRRKKRNSNSTPLFLANKSMSVARSFRAHQWRIIAAAENCFCLLAWILIIPSWTSLTSRHRLIVSMSAANFLCMM